MIPIHTEDFRINVKRLLRVNYATFSILRYSLAKWHIKIHNAKYIQVKSEYVRKPQLSNKYENTNRPTTLIASGQKHTARFTEKSYCAMLLLI